LSVRSRKTDGDGPLRLGQGLQQLGVDPGARDQRETTGRDPDALQRGPVVGVLHQRHRVVAIEKISQRRGQDAAKRAGAGAVAGEGVAEPGERVDLGPVEPDRRQSAEHAALQSDEMHQLRRHRAGDPAQRQDGGQGDDGRDAAAAERDGVQNEALGPDRLGVGADLGGDVDFEPGIARGARHRQAVRQEGPVLGDHIQNCAGPTHHVRNVIPPRLPPDRAASLPGTLAEFEAIRRPVPEYDRPPHRFLHYFVVFLFITMAWVPCAGRVRRLRQRQLVDRRRPSVRRRISETKALYVLAFIIVRTLRTNG
jgi:hypothetical protein